MTVVTYMMRKASLDDKDAQHARGIGSPASGAHRTHGLRPTLSHVDVFCAALGGNQGNLGSVLRCLTHERHRSGWSAPSWCRVPRDVYASDYRDSRWAWEGKRAVEEHEVGCTPSCSRTAVSNDPVEECSSVKRLKPRERKAQAASLLEQARCCFSRAVGHIRLQRPHSGWCCQARSPSPPLQ